MSNHHFRNPTRRRFLLAALPAITTPTVLRAASKRDTYERDVEFLIKELERKAGHFFAVKKIDWKKVTEPFRDEVKRVKDDESHLKLCGRLVARLRDGHAAIVDSNVKLPDESRGRRFTGPRVHLLTVGEKVIVRAAFKDAANAGVQVGMGVERIDDTEAREWLAKTVARMSDERGFSTDHEAVYAACHWGLADWEGTPISFDLVQGSQRKKVRIVRSGGPNFAPFGPIFPPKDVQTTGRQSYGKTTAGHGYVHLRDVPGTLPEQLDTMLAAFGNVPGLILDCRANGGGGCDHAAVFGRFVPAGQKWRQYQSAGAMPFGGPMVVIGDAGTRSAGETIAGQFKEDGRALMIGDTATAGTSSQKERLEVPSGLFRVYFSVGINKGRFNGGKGIEGIGVPPHLPTPYEPADLLAGRDTQIVKAEEFLTRGLPKDKVPWEARRT